MTRRIEGTICGVDVEAFKKPPTPEELGAIVACMDSEDQAAFLIAFGEKLYFRCSIEGYGVQTAYIRQAVVAQEEKFQTGYGSALIRELQIDEADGETP